ncbi:hypothetical protein CARUB_v10025561mg [Capsella rubella]|uniref:E3 ubiquitin-protein ligase APD1-4 middle domain-containing protein n=1 Tax=Capsella rubella TaxID=81985 RepID=R0G1X9_9BRAS|nr:hypothetical protein CARUB_v10025561mg [Capsella rubella]
MPWFCYAFVFLFLFFGSVIMTQSVYSAENVWLGPNSSILVDPSSVFVESIKVKEMDYSKSGLQLYGFYGSPPQLNRFVNWSESRVLPAWQYYFNEGTLLNITYKVEPLGSAVQLMVDEGSGMIQLEISKSSSYHLTLTNLKRKDVKVELNTDVRAVLYDTKQSFYNCTFGSGECTFKLYAMSLVGSSVVVASPTLSQGASIEDEWFIKISYQHRWITYVICIGLAVCFTLLATQVCSGEGPLTENDSARTCLLAEKADDGSCNETVTNDDADLEESIGNVEEARQRSMSLSDIPRVFDPSDYCFSCVFCGIMLDRACERCPMCGRRMKTLKRTETA